MENNGVFHTPFYWYCSNVLSAHQVIHNLSGILCFMCDDFHLWDGGSRFKMVDKDTSWHNLDFRFRRSPSAVTSSTCPEQLSITFKNSCGFSIFITFIVFLPSLYL